MINDKYKVEALYDLNFLSTLANAAALYDLEIKKQNNGNSTESIEILFHDKNQKYSYTFSSRDVLKSIGSPLFYDVHIGQYYDAKELCEFNDIFYGEEDDFD